MSRLFEGRNGSPHPDRRHLIKEIHRGLSGMRQPFVHRPDKGGRGSAAASDGVRAGTYDQLQILREIIRLLTVEGLAVLELMGRRWRESPWYGRVQWKMKQIRERAGAPATTPAAASPEPDGEPWRDEAGAS